MTVTYALTTRTPSRSSYTTSVDSTCIAHDRSRAATFSGAMIDGWLAEDRAAVAPAGA